MLMRVNVSTLLNATLKFVQDNTTDVEYCTEEWEWTETHRSLLAIMSLIIISIGTCGNTISYLVLSQKSYKNNVMSSALRYLAILDIIIIWTVILELFYKGLIGFDMGLTSTKFCILFQFYSLMMTSCGNWMLVTITLTRLIHLKCPFKTQIICSKFNYYALIVLIHMMVIGIYGTFSLSILNHNHLDHYSSHPHSCYVMLSKEEAKHILYLITNVTINFLAPGCLLLAFNCMIAKEIIKMEEREQMLKAKPFAQLSGTERVRDDSKSDMGSEKVTKSDIGSGKVTMSDTASEKVSHSTINSSLNALEYELQGPSIMTSYTADRNASDAICSSPHSSKDMKYDTGEPVDFDGVFSGDWLLFQETEFKAQSKKKRRLCVKKVGYKRVNKSWMIRNFLKTEEDMSQNSSKRPKTSSSAIVSSGKATSASSEGTYISASTKVSSYAFVGLQIQRKPSIELEKTNPPVEKTNPPFENGNPPLEKTNPPLEKTNPPPLEKTNPPLEKTNPPLEKTNPPIGKKNPPIGKNIKPKGSGAIRFSVTLNPSTSVDSRPVFKNAWNAFSRVSCVLKQPINLDNESWPSSSDNPESREEDSYYYQGAENETTHTAVQSSPSTNNRENTGEAKKDGRVQSLTHLLMVASSVFLLLNAPYWMYHLFARSWKYDGDPGCARRRFLRHMLLLLRYSNHCMNFFFYCATGSRFRQEILIWWQSINK